MDEKIDGSILYRYLRIDLRRRTIKFSTGNMIWHEIRLSPTIPTQPPMTCELWMVKLIDGWMDGWMDELMDCWDG